MSDLIISVSEEQAEVLQELAAHYRISVEAVINGIIDEFIEQRRDSEAATQKINYIDLLGNS